MKIKFIKSKSSVINEIIVSQVIKARKHAYANLLSFLTKVFYYVIKII